MWLQCTGVEQLHGYWVAETIGSPVTGEMGHLGTKATGQENPGTPVCMLHGETGRRSGAPAHTEHGSLAENSVRAGSLLISKETDCRGADCKPGGIACEVQTQKGPSLRLNLPVRNSVTILKKVS